MEGGERAGTGTTGKRDFDFASYPILYAVRTGEGVFHGLAGKELKAYCIHC